MSVLVTVKNQLIFMGICPPSTFENRDLITFIHVSLVFISLLTYISAVLCFMICKATKFVEFAEAGLFVSVNVLHISLYYLLVSKRSQLYSLLGLMEKISEISKRDK